MGDGSVLSVMREMHGASDDAVLVVGKEISLAGRASVVVKMADRPPSTGHLA